jgi:glutamyl-tRNA synthetase
MKFTGGDTVVTFGKLWYLQKAHASRYVAAAANGDRSKMDLMTGLITRVLEKEHLIERLRSASGQEKLKAYIFKLLEADARNYNNALEFVKRNKYFFEAPDEMALVDSKPTLVLDKLPREIASSILPEDVAGALSFLEQIPADEWTAEVIRECVVNESAFKANAISLRCDCAQLNMEKSMELLKSEWRKLIHKWIRWAVTAGKDGPDGAKTMDILGREETLSRIEKASKVLRELRFRNHLER